MMLKATLENRTRDHLRRTNLVTNLIVRARKISDYDGTPTRALVEFQHSSNGKQPGDPVKGGKRIVDIATDMAGEDLAKRGKGEVLRIVLGSDCFDTVKQKLTKMGEQLTAIEDIARSTDFA